MKRRLLTVVKYSAIALPILLILMWWILFCPKCERRSAGKACTENLQKIDGAKEQWALEKGKKVGDRPTWDDLVSPTSGTAFLRKMPYCPQGGTYTIGAIGEDPICSVVQRDNEFPWIIYYDQEQLCFRTYRRPQPKDCLHVLP
jgi:hypothetical protein